jgi:hypothetical protein
MIILLRKAHERERESEEDMGSGYERRHLSFNPRSSFLCQLKIIPSTQDDISNALLTFTENLKFKSDFSSSKEET